MIRVVVVKSARSCMMLAAVLNIATLSCMPPYRRATDVAVLLYSLPAVCANYVFFY